MVNIGAYKIPEIQKQYSKAKDELEDIEYNVKTWIGRDGQPSNLHHMWDKYSLSKYKV